MPCGGGALPRLGRGGAPSPHNTICRSPVLDRDSFWLRLPGKQLPQHVLQNASVGVVESFLGRVDTDDGLKFACLAALYTHCNLASGRKLVDYLANAGNFENFFAGRSEEHTSELQSPTY